MKKSLRCEIVTGYLFLCLIRSLFHILTTSSQLTYYPQKSYVVSTIHNFFRRVNTWYPQSEYLIFLLSGLAKDALFFDSSVVELNKHEPRTSLDELQTFPTDRCGCKWSKWIIRCLLQRGYVLILNYGVHFHTWELREGKNESNNYAECYWHC